MLILALDAFTASKVLIMTHCEIVDNSVSYSVNSHFLVLAMEFENVKGILKNVCKFKFRL